MAIPAIALTNYEWREIGNTGSHVRSGIARMPPGVVEIIGGGTTSLVGRLKDGNILKYSIVEGESERDFDVEAAIYEALGKHPRIIGFLGRSEHGLQLESGSSLVQRLLTVDDPTLRLRWARQTAEGLAYLHSRRVLHCDLHPDNLLLNRDDNIKMCEFQGKMGELDGAAAERTRYCPVPISSRRSTPTFSPLAVQSSGS